MKAKRVFLTVLDSVGIGALPDAAAYQDEGSNTLKSCARSPFFRMQNMEKLGLFHITGAPFYREGTDFTGMVARAAERSMGKDTTTGHWEMAGLISREPLPTFPQGFPTELIREIETLSGRPVLCNKPFSGTKVIEEYGEEMMEKKALIVYTSADSVLQIAAHEEVVPLSELYEICGKVRGICQGPWGVGRVIARPFRGEPPHFSRTPGRHDYSLLPPGETMLDRLVQGGKDVIAIGKISDIFGGRGITRQVPSKNNMEGMETMLRWLDRDFNGLCFTNLVDFDMLYGHRNDVDGYARALAAFDAWIPAVLEKMGPEDVWIITADHGCDPGTPSTDHSREYVPVVITGKTMPSGVNMGTWPSFVPIGQLVEELLLQNQPVLSEEMLLEKVDHTLLGVEATWNQISQICEDALTYHTASVCIPPNYVEQAAAQYGSRGLKICTVIGFPNGYMTTKAKVEEARDALNKGADELDMVIPVGWLKDGRFLEIQEEIRQMKEVCKEHILKVIIEACLLTDEEKIRMCQIVGEAGADYIKTSTGFSSDGATFADVALFARHVPEGVKIKAAGGIASFEDARLFVRLGADRLGTSRLVKEKKKEESFGEY